MQQTDFSFANDIRAAVELRTPKTARMLLLTGVGLMATFVIWAYFAVLDEVKRGNGRVIPARLVQTIQSLEGGIIEQILVHEGTVVQQGQPLMRINDTKFASEFGEIRERRAAVAARVARLQAEAQGQFRLVFPDELIKSAPQAVETEKSVFETRTRKVAQDIDVLTQQERPAIPALRPFPFVDFFSRTPGPPPFSSMNSTPADSSPRRSTMPFFETKGGIFRVPLAWREPGYKIGLRWPTRHPRPRF